MKTRLALGVVPFAAFAFLVVPFANSVAAAPQGIPALQGAAPRASRPQTASPVGSPPVASPSVASPPIELHAGPGYGAVDLVWTASPGACETFQVMRSPTNKEDWQPIGPETSDVGAVVGPNGPQLRYRDGAVRPGVEYAYKVGCHRSGSWSYSAPVRVAMPKAVLRFHAIYPNPTDTVARIEYEIGEPGPATLEICNLLGVRVRTLLDGPAAAGLAAATWDGKDDAGRPLGPGVYFARLTSEGQVLRRHIALIR
jgi:hypothetical protein